MDFGSQSPNDRRAQGASAATDNGRGDDPRDESTLSADDFRRLGVRQHESRQTVIRQAASKTTRTLARRHLVAPSARTEQQLILVATSTYRLLDPRNRQDETQRVHVGRILPNALHWAGRTQFSSGPFDSAEDLDDHDQSTPSDAAEKLDDVPQTGLHLNTSWSESLDESDLLRRRWLRISWFRRQLHQPVVLVLLSAVLIATSFWVYGLSQKSNTLFVAIRERETAENTPARQTAKPVASDILNHDRVAPTAAEQENADDADSQPKATEPRAAAGEMDVNPQTGTVATDDVSPKEVTPEVNQVEQKTTDDLRPNGVAETERPIEPRENAIGLVDVDETMLPISELEPDVELELLLEQLSWVSDFDDPTSPVPAPTPGPAPAAVPAHNAPPDAQLVSQSRQQLESLVPALARSRSIKSAELALSGLADLQLPAQNATSDQWALRIAMAECEWLVGDFSTAHQHLLPLSKIYDVSLDDLLTRTFVDVPSPIDSAELHLILLTNGLPLADHLMINQSHANCRRVLAAVRHSAKFVTEGELPKQLDDFREAALTAARLSETTQQIAESTPDQVSSTQAGIAGRYYCLMLRRWKTGLPWLAEGSDPRLAALAAEELSLNLEDGLSAERLEIAKRWLSFAERNDGREADSMRLHAIDLLQQSDLSPRGLRHLEAERMIDEIREALPGYLLAITEIEKQPTRSGKAGNPAQPDRSVTQPAQAGSAAAPMKPATGQQPAEASLGSLAGKVLCDDQDVGIHLEYQPSMAIGAKMFDQVAKKLGRDVFKWTLQLEGRFELQEETDLQLHIAQSTGDLKQEIMLDNQPVNFPEGLLTTRLVAGKGEHQLAWTVSGSQIKVVFIAVQDAKTGAPIEIHPLPESDSDDSPVNLTIQILKSSP